MDDEHDPLRDYIERVLRAQSAAQARGVLNMWTVFEHPHDAPDCIVVRRFEIGGGAKEPLATDDKIMLLGTPVAIEMMALVFERCGLHRLPRSPGDHRSVVETWL